MQTIINLIDNFLNRITMYRLIFYLLIILILIAMIFGYFNIIPYSPESISFSTIFLVLISWFANSLFSKVFDAPVNLESAYITALILALIVTPASSFSSYLFLFWVAVLAMASKYILAINKRHIFNPAAVAIVLTAFFANQSASWWVGNIQMAPFVIIGGYLIVRKIHREKMVFYFILTALLTTLGFTILKGGDFVSIIQNVLFHSSLFFFAFIMLTEPLTSPNAHNMRYLYAVLVGFLFVPDIHLGNLYSTPELALIGGNIFSYLVSPKEKLILTLKEKIAIAPNTFDFIFNLPQKISYLPGQYLEWTLTHENADDRGNRRYFTLASSPTEDTLRIGVKFNEPSSSFKKALLSLDDQTPIVASQKSGDFVLPKDVGQKLVFIAGGIGITPFRSILKYLIDKHEKRDIVMLYSNKFASEIVYQSVFSQAANELGIKIVYVVTDQVGRINETMIKKEVPDFTQRFFYLSGPHNMVIAFQETLKKMGIKEALIKSDFFPGFV